MALPVTISGLSTSNALTTKPFLSSGGNVYVLGIHDTDVDLVRAFKATDPTSSFSNVGTDFSLTSTNPATKIHAVQSGDNLHVVTVDAAAASAVDIRYHVFSMSSDSWTTTNETVKNDASYTGLTGYSLTASISIRSDGDIIVLYNGSTAASMGTDYNRVKYARKEGSTWTIDVAVDNAGATNWSAMEVLRGSSDRMHFLFQDANAPAAYQRSLTSTNTLQTFPSSYSTSINGSPTTMVQIGTSYDSSGTQKVRYPLIMSTANTIESVKFDSADTPTVTTDADITGATGANVSNLFRASFAADGTTLWHLFINSADNDINTQSNAADAGWDTPAEFHDDASAIFSAKCNVYTRGSNITLGITYGVTGGLKYHEKVLSTGGITGEHSKTLSALTKTQAGTVAVAGAHAKTLTAIGKTQAGTVAVVGEHSKTLAAIGKTQEGSVYWLADSAVTLAAIGKTQTGTVAVVGVHSKTLNPLSFTQAGTVAVAGAHAKTLNPLGFTQAGTVAVAGAHSKTLAPLGFTQTGTVAAAGAQGEHSATLAAIGKSQAGTVAVSGSHSKTLASIQATQAGTVAVSGSSSKTLSPIGFTQAGSAAVVGSSSKTLNPLGFLQEGVVATGPQGESSVTLAALQATQAGTVPAVGSSAVTLAGIQATQTGTVTGGSIIIIDGGDDAPRRRTGPRRTKRPLDVLIDETIESLSRPGPAPAPAPLMTRSINPATIVALTLAMTGPPPAPFLPTTLPSRTRPLEDEYDDDDLMLILLSVL